MTYYNVRLWLLLKRLTSILFKKDTYQILEANVLFESSIEPRVKSKYSFVEFPRQTRLCKASFEKNEVASQYPHVSVSPPFVDVVHSSVSTKYLLVSYLNVLA